MEKPDIGSDTWFRLVQQHPKLQTLFEIARDVRDPGPPDSFCPIHIFEMVFQSQMPDFWASWPNSLLCSYPPGSYERENGDALSQAEYDVAALTILHALPPYRESASYRGTKSD